MTAVTKCPCATHVGDLAPAHHEWLVTVESRGSAGFADLVGFIASQTDEPPADGELHYLEMPVFVAVHNWQDPEAMHRMVEQLVSMASVVKQQKCADEWQAAEAERKAAVLRSSALGGDQ